jgi:3',5'-cyclic AMP phosphodiesterase CpdA
MLKLSKDLKILHLSDLHFGRINGEVVTKLTDFILKAQDQDLDLIVLTGDLTQRARSKQFMEARDFILKFRTPIVAVPGNHDIPLYNLFSRFFRPLNTFRKVIAPHIQDLHETSDFIVCGINTPNRYTVMKGHLTTKEIHKLKGVFHDKQKVKIIACHHSLHIEKLRPKLDDLVKVSQPHVILYGHDHQSGVYFIDDQKSFPLLVAAGTGASTRIRQESNSFNFLQISSTKIDVTTYNYNGTDFHVATTFSHEI